MLKMNVLRKNLQKVNNYEFIFKNMHKNSFKKRSYTVSHLRQGNIVTAKINL